MYGEAARYYDLIHDVRGRDATGEAEMVIGELRRRNPDARSLLDVACGTGAHLPRFSQVYEVVGVDLSADMLAIAAERCPDVPLQQADMRDLDLGRRFDAIVCLFAGIGYLAEEAELRQVIATMSAHLEDGGVLLIEGWIEPSYWIEGGVVNVESALDADLAVARLVRSRRDGIMSELFIRHTVATPEGFTTIDDCHRMRLSDPGEFASAYVDAGLSFERLPHMLHPGRAVYAGLKSRR